jgi:hypothetical protein
MPKAPAMVLEGVEGRQALVLGFQVRSIDGFFDKRGGY